MINNVPAAPDAEREATADIIIRLDALTRDVAERGDEEGARSLWVALQAVRRHLNRIAAQ